MALATLYAAAAGTSAGSALRDTWDAEFGLDPTEETKIADWVTQPLGAQKMGNNIYLRKIPTMTVQTLTPSATAATRGGMTFNTSTLSRVTAAANMVYSGTAIDRASLNRAIEDAGLRSALKTQTLASVKEKLDTDLFALAASLSVTETGAAIDDAVVRSALGQLATNAKGKFTEDSVKLLVVHPGQLKNVWNIPAIKEYQIRGTVGAAVNAKMNAYGLVWRESGLVYKPAATSYNPLLLKDAWALAFNDKPQMLDVQIDGLSEIFIAVAEYGVCEWFDSSGVSINIT